MIYEASMEGINKKEDNLAHHVDECVSGGIIRKRSKTIGKFW